eukprot:1696816-Prorocentrum_lima.AAC.1
MDSKRPCDCQLPSREGGKPAARLPEGGAWACQPVGSPVLSVELWASMIASTWYTWKMCLDLGNIFRKGQ